VFPCLATINPSFTVRAEQDSFEAAALMQAIQVAVGLSWQPTILVVDLLHLPDLVADTTPEATPATLYTTLRDADWLQALAQYLQTAGLSSLQSRSWAEVLRQLKHQSPDLLLICLRGHQTSPTVLHAIETLQQLQLTIPILVFDQRQSSSQAPVTSDPETPADTAMSELTVELAAIATQILSPGLPVEELLEQIYQALGSSKPPE
ncbi:MAG TPA: hypothetical protein V6C63_08830, partial [Allocoleopsis sp.]